MGWGVRRSGGTVGLGLPNLRLEWVVEELRAQGLLPKAEDSPDGLELLDRFIQGKPLAGKRVRRRRAEMLGAGDENECLNVRQVARMLGVCEKTVRRMIALKDLPSVRVRGAVRVKRRSVDEWVSAREGGR